MKRLELFYKLRNEWSASNVEQVQHLLRILSTKSHEDEKDYLLPRIRLFVSKIHAKWNSCYRKESIFLSRHASWLDTDFEVYTPTSSGRPATPFEDASQDLKTRRTNAIRSSASTQELIHAAASSLHVDGHRDSARLMREVFAGSPERPKRVKVALEAQQTDQSTIQPYSSDEALNMMVEAKLTKAQYLLLRRGASSHNAPLYPSYEHIRNAKKQCYPPDEAVHITESSAEVSLQSLLDLTVSRLLTLLGSGLESLSVEQRKGMVLICKWGSDGSSGYTMFKQVSVDPCLDDSSLYMTSLVPLQLYTTGESGGKKIVWQNPRPSSPRYCRPIKFEFAKETKAHVLQETQRVEREICELVPYMGVESGLDVQVVYTMHMTMVDGKLCNIITGHASTQSCFICGAKPSQMNDFEALGKLTDKSEAYKLGLSTLHGWIRSFEYLLHISYKRGIRKWQAKTPQEKSSVKEEKEKIQKEFKLRLGLSIDMPKQGFGNTNDGNTARSFFTNAEETSKITGIDKGVVESLRAVLCALGSGYEINVDKYASFCMDTANKCVELYGWYPMPPTVHKILFHGASIINAAPLPIGMLSEEAQESRHKDCKHIRIAQTRKTSREECNEDLLHMCLISSDPVITSLRKLPKKSSTKPLSQDVIQLLREPDLTFIPTITDESESEEEVE